MKCHLAFWVLLSLDPYVLLGVRNLEEEKKKARGGVAISPHPPGFMVLPFGPCVFASGEKEGVLGEGEREGTFPWFWHSLSYSPHHCDSLLKTTSGCVIRATTPGRNCRIRPTYRTTNAIIVYIQYNNRIRDVFYNLAPDFIVTYSTCITPYLDRKSR